MKDGKIPMSVVCPHCVKGGDVELGAPQGAIKQYTWAVTCTLCRKTFVVSVVVKKSAMTGAN